METVMRIFLSQCWRDEQTCFKGAIILIFGVITSISALCNSAKLMLGIHQALLLINYDILCPFVGILQIYTAYLCKVNLPGKHTLFILTVFIGASAHSK